MIYNTSGEIISSHLCYHLFKYGTFKQYQLVQYGLKDYNINLNTNRRVEKEKDLVEEFKGYFGKDANIKVNYVDEIPVLNSGKRKEVTNTYYKN
jgi:phenylacetate-CoA ligase